MKPSSLVVLRIKHSTVISLVQTSSSCLALAASCKAFSADTLTIAFIMLYPSLVRLSSLEGTAEYVTHRMQMGLVLIPPQMCMLAEKSIRNVLNTNDNADVLLALHTPTSASPPPAADRAIPNTGIKT
ncbi:hypothetical protein ID866_1878 [Astraeus odoratus]|nr:hypothetical protein ID866_1878 [Astraeus odoratus]